ncbi:uncharacterized protein [Triticum aestivum]|uniref:uncharacterized protein isoform X1 n=1 Tax=Triticum aestivum TaxID=4565 RepID=UPI001D02F02F|nr:uncharacterized protein LOC123070167 isoform X1 [Triticum aestivum]
MRGCACSTVQVTPVDAPTACRRILLLLPMSHLAFSSVDKFADERGLRIEPADANLLACHPPPQPSPPPRCTTAYSSHGQAQVPPPVVSPAPATNTGRCPFCHNGSSTNTNVVILNQFLTRPPRKPCSCMLTPKVLT